MSAESASNDRWPPLPYDSWKDTYHTLHMFLQIGGKVALAFAPPVNHSWGVAYQLTARGLTTRLLQHGSRWFSICFDLIDHQLLVVTQDGDSRAIDLASRSVAELYRDVMAALDAMRLPVKIWTMPSEVPNPVRFTEQTTHYPYDADAVNRLWRILVQSEQVLTRARCGFVGKCSPAHFFWGGPDLALTRFSGRLAPPREGPAFMREAYSHEVISHGFWPGNEQLPEPVYYGYAAPEPAGFKEARVEPAGAYYHRDLGEFILPYEAVRTAADPAADLEAFVNSTYDRAATLGGWDRRALER